MLMRCLMFLSLFFAVTTWAQDTDTSDQKETKQIHETQSSHIDSPSTEPTTTPSPDLDQATASYETAFIKTIVVLVGILVLIFLTIWMFKKVSNGRLKSFNYLKSIKILEKRPLSPKSMLYLIEVGGKQILLAESQLQIKTLTKLDWAQDNKDL